MRSSRPSPPSWLRRPSPRIIAVAAGVALTGAVAALGWGTAMVVQGEAASVRAAVPTIAPESNDEGSPEAQARRSGGAAAVPETIKLARDPLTAQEVAYARSLATLDAAFAEIVGADGRLPVYLSTTISEPEAYSDGARRFELAYYDYGTDRVATFLVNVTTGTVEKVDAAGGVQPPPADSEVTEAFELLLADPASEGLKSAYLAATGEELTAPTQTLFNGSSFVATAGTVGAQECGTQRCVLLLVQTPDGRWLPSTDVAVNLSSRTVLPVK